MYVWPEYDLHRTPEVTGPQDQARVRPLAGRRRTARRHARAPMPARRRDGPARTVPAANRRCRRVGAGGGVHTSADSANEASSTPTRGRWRGPSRPRRAYRRLANPGMARSQRPTSGAGGYERPPLARTRTRRHPPHPDAVSILNPAIQDATARDYRRCSRIPRVMAFGAGGLWREGAHRGHSGTRDRLDRCRRLAPRWSRRVRPCQPPYPTRSSPAAAGSTARAVASRVTAAVGSATTVTHHEDTRRFTRRWSRSRSTTAPDTAAGVKLRRRLQRDQRSGPDLA